MDIDSLYQKFLRARSIATDTRVITDGSMFFALKGPKFNANVFAEEALRKGAAWAVVDEKQFANDKRCLLVDDVLTALQDLARHHRTQLRIPVIGLTGSNGKTTTKELLGAVLNSKYKTLTTKGNLNNHIGVPLSILAIEDTTEVAVIEMGANHVGEIALLAGIANPTHGLITNIGKGHVGTFGGFENVIRGKSELYQHLIQNNGIVFINSRNPLLANMAKRFKAPLFYPALGDYYACELTSADPYVEVKTESGATIKTQLVGGYNFENIAAALCVGKYFKVDEQAANAAVTSYEPGNMRSQVIQKGSNTILLDAYNANPSSMEAAIQNLSDMKAMHKVAILGDMYELGDESEAEHNKLGKLLAASGIDEVYLCGSLIRPALAVLPGAQYFEKKEQLAEYLKTHRPQNSTILIKASRGMALEQVVALLQ
jgi:UDP-N-acetylmuramoyl-tripeptide--D-alanyl-D-alanine ligase